MPVVGVLAAGPRLLPVRRTAAECELQTLVQPHNRFLSSLECLLLHQPTVALLLIAASSLFGAGAGAASGSSAAAGKPASAAAVAPGPLVDINRASRAQLKTLPGIGDAYADRIVAGRPYLTKADLVTNQALPAGVYLSIKGRIIARPDPNRPLPTAGKP